MPITCVCSQRRYGSRHYLQGLEPSLSGADVELLALPNLRTILLPNTFIFCFLLFLFFFLVSGGGVVEAFFFLHSFVFCLKRASRLTFFLSFLLSPASCILLRFPFLFFHYSILSSRKETYLVAYSMKYTFVIASLQNS